MMHNDKMLYIIDEGGYIMKKLRLIILLMVIMLLPMDAQAASKAKLSASKKSVTVGQTVKISMKNNKKKVKWSVSNGKIKIVKKTNKYAKIKAVKAGKATLKAKVGKKTYKCKITVKKKKTKEDPSQYTGYYTDAYDADYLIIKHDGKNYRAEWCAWRKTTFGYPHGMIGEKKGDVIRFTDYSQGNMLVIIDVKFIENSKVELTVVESNFRYVKAGEQHVYKKKSSKVDY